MAQEYGLEAELRRIRHAQQAAVGIAAVQSAQLNDLNRLQEMSVGVGADQALSLRSISRTLESIDCNIGNVHSQLLEIRKATQDAVQVQQELLTRDNMQGWLEQFIYDMEKLLAEFGGTECKLEPARRYFVLRDVLNVIDRDNIATPVIRGRENKAAFDKALAAVQQMKGALERTEEVRQAIAWVKEEEKRQARLEEEERDRQRRAENEEALRKHQEKERERKQREQEQAEQGREHSRRKKLARPFQEELDAVEAQIAPLEKSLKKMTFGFWYKKRFKWLVSYPDALRHWVHERVKSVPPQYKLELVAQYVYLFFSYVVQFYLWIVCLVCGGFIWIPIVYSKDAQRLRDPTEAEIAPLRARRGELSHKIDEVMKTGVV